MTATKRGHRAQRVSRGLSPRPRQLPSQHNHPGDLRLPATGADEPTPSRSPSRSNCSSASTLYKLRRSSLKSLPEFLNILTFRLT